MTAPRWRLVAAGVAALFILAETGIRRTGLVDFPIYTRSQDFGYVPSGKQSGAFLGSNRWAFNDRNMGVEAPWQPTQRKDILLVGNSIIMGGNPYDQADKVAPLLQLRLGAACAVWPVAAGGWSTVNEVRFLESNPDLVAGSDFFIWEYMPGQMDRVSPWTRETVHPTRKPLWATGYVLRKALFERFLAGRATGPPTPAETAENYRRFDLMLGRLTASARRSPAGIIVLYPDRAQLAAARQGVEWANDRPQLERLAAAHGLALIDVAQVAQWSEAMYRDSVHPTPEGNRILASALADAIRRLTGSLACSGPP